MATCKFNFFAKYILATYKVSVASTCCNCFGYGKCHFNTLPLSLITEGERVLYFFSCVDRCDRTWDAIVSFLLLLSMSAEKPECLWVKDKK